MRIVLFDLPEDRVRLFPLTLTRPISHLRLGILTIQEKWQHFFPNAELEIHSDKYLAPKYGAVDINEPALWIDASVLPNSELVKAITDLEKDQSLFHEDQALAFKGFTPKDAQSGKKIEYQARISKIRRTWDLFTLNGQEIRNDFKLLTDGRKSKEIIDSHTKVYGSEIFIEEGAKIKAAVLNSETGPIYIGKGAEVQEGSLIRGPFALGEQAVVSMGAKMRSDTTIGPWCKAGGEISNSILMGYSSKGHDGFLGNSVIGEWCNLGADTNNSNLKNNYKPVKMWDYERKDYIESGLQFCGLIMGDHSKAGINTMFNTGTTVGVLANIFGPGFPGTYIPSFSWGGVSGFSSYQIDKAFETAGLVMKRRNLLLTVGDKAILNHIFEHFSS